jgi:hypothetical protein
MHVTALAIVIAAFCIVWLVQAGRIFVNLSQIRDLMRIDAPEPERWPRVSAIVPARNEAADIARSLASRLADGYPELELVVVDDRSGDETPAIIADFAEKDDRVVPVRVEELPKGWLGKVHALDVGVGAAGGEWLLFSDADVELAPGALKRAVSHAVANRLDLLALIPEFRSTSGIVDLLWAIFVRVMALAVSPESVRNPLSKVAVGSGGFTLVRRSAFDATPGFSHLKLETADDMALGLMVKRAGCLCDYVNGRGAASVSIYGSLRAFFRGVEKNGGTFAGTPFALVAAAFAGFGLVEYSPLAALALGYAAHIGWLAALGAATAIVATAATVLPMWRNTGMIWPALLWPIGWPLMAGGVLRSSWLVHRRGGVIWRDTFYPSDELIAAQRFRIG